MKTHLQCHFYIAQTKKDQAPLLPNPYLLDLSQKQNRADKFDPKLQLQSPKDWKLLLKTMKKRTSLE